VIFILDFGKIIKEMDKEIINGKMEMSIMDNGLIINDKA
jgi:hypothetical protein